MARVQGTLTALNDVLAFPNNNDEINGGGSVQYGVGGAGTIVVEVHNGYNVGGAPEWYALKLTDNTKASVDNLAAAGIAFFDLIGVAGVRVRKSVAGGGPVTVALAIKRG